MKRMASPSSIMILSLMLMTIYMCCHCQGCEFPDFLQSIRDGPAREWHQQNVDIHRAREHRYTHVARFYGKKMEVEILGPKHNTHAHHQPKYYSRRCVLEIEPGQFLVTHNVEGGSLQQYMCIEFIKRSDHVVQIKHSMLSQVQDPRLCADSGMETSNWPLINKANLFKTSEPCPLEGGFNARFFDRTQHVGFCDVYEGETRIESECMKGEGMFFRFRYDQCVPEGFPMKKEQQLYCMANWRDDNYKYVIVRHDTHDHQWCFRYPANSYNYFNGVLFQDLLCDPMKTPNETDKYLTIGMTRASAQSFNDLCMDDYEGCSYWTKPCERPGSNTHMTCARMCGLCNNTHPSPCRLPKSLHGEWLEDNRLGHDIVDIRTSGFSKYQYDDFKCVRWQENPYDNDPDLAEEMMVSTFDNGCKPRYTCVQFKKHSPSVLHYKMSRSQVWPFYDTDWKNINCSSFHYKDEDEPVGDTHRSRHFKALVSMDTITNIDCELPEPLDVTLYVEDGITCHGMLTQKSTSLYRNKRLQLLLYDCPNRPPQQEFACLDTHRHGTLSHQIIITESVDNTNEYQCWLFSAAPEHMLYVLPLRYCNEGSAQRIRNGDFQPISTFKIKMPPTTTSTTTQSPSANIIVESIINNPEGQPVNKKLNEEYVLEEAYEKEQDTMVKMNDISKTGDGIPDSYSHVAGKNNQPEGKMLVSEKSDMEKAPKPPESALNSYSNAITFKMGILCLSLALITAMFH